MTVSETAKSLRRELRAAKLKKFWKEMPFLGDYETFKKSLDGLAMLRCPKACRGGGGNPSCKIRICARKKNYWSCAECDDFATCEKLSVISTSHKNENLKILKKLRKGQIIVTEEDCENP